LNPLGNAIEFGVDLDDIIFFVPREKVKFSRLSRLTFSFAPNYNELKKIW
jgi:hypothetical protein